MEVSKPDVIIKAAVNQLCRWVEMVFARSIFRRHRKQSPGIGFHVGFRASSAKQKQKPAPGLPCGFVIFAFAIAPLARSPHPPRC